MAVQAVGEKKEGGMFRREIEGVGVGFCKI